MGNGSQFFGYLNWYHTALVFRQNQSSGEAEYWTLEFDSTADSLFSTIAPSINGTDLVWGNLDARYCLRKGLYWGREHWRKSFEMVMTLSAQQIHDTLKKDIL